MTNQLILPKTDIMLSSCKATTKITQLIEKYPIDGFCYTKIYNDGSMIDTSNRADILEHYYYHTYNYADAFPDICPELLTNEFFLCSCYQSDNDMMSLLYKEFGASHVLILSNSYPNYSETFWFGSTQYDRFVNFCLNNLALLRQFAAYFKEASTDIVSQLSQDKIHRVLSADTIAKNEQFIASLVPNSPAANASSLSAAPHFMITNGAKVYLTQREIDVVTWCVKGKTALETALILSISKRTVEKHLDNIKKKLGCYKLSSLIRLAMSDKLFQERLQ